MPFATRLPRSTAWRTPTPGPPTSTARSLPAREKRLQDRSAYLRLKTDTNEVREVNDEAIQITESVGGIVDELAV